MENRIKGKPEWSKGLEQKPLAGKLRQIIATVGQNLRPNLAGRAKCSSVNGKLKTEAGFQHLVEQWSYNAMRL